MSGFNYYLIKFQYDHLCGLCFAACICLIGGVRCRWGQMVDNSEHLYNRVAYVDKNVQLNIRS